MAPSHPPHDLRLQDLTLGPGGDPRAFLRVFLAVAVTGWVLVGALNVAVNPRAEFPVQLLRPLVVATTGDPTGKTATFEASNRSFQAVLLGSSTAMLYRTRILAAADAGPAFNFAVPDMTPERMVDLYGRLKAEGRLPRVLYLALDQYMLVWPSSQEAPAQPAAQRDWEDLLGRAASSTLSPDYVLDSLRSLRFALAGYPPTPPVADANGDYLQLPYIAAGLARPPADRAAAIPAYLQDKRPIYGHPLQGDRAAALLHLLGMARQDQVRVVVLYQPVHPRLFQAYAGAVDTHAQAKALLLGACWANLTVLDDVDPVAHGWALGHFYDAAHFDQEMSDEVLQDAVTGRGDLCSH